MVAFALRRASALGTSTWVTFAVWCWSRHVEGLNCIWLWWWWKEDSNLGEIHLYLYLSLSGFRPGEMAAKFLPLCSAGFVRTYRTSTRQKIHSEILAEGPGPPQSGKSMRDGHENRNLQVSWSSIRGLMWFNVMWCEELLSRLGHELIRSMRVRLKIWDVSRRKNSDIHSWCGFSFNQVAF